MTNIQTVKQFESNLIGIIKHSYDNLKLSEDDAIEFTNKFFIYVTESAYDEDPIKVPYVISGMMDNYILVGISNGSEVEINLDHVESIYELAHIADTIQSGYFSILAQ